MSYLLKIQSSAKQQNSEEKLRQVIVFNAILNHSSLLMNILSKS